MARAAVASAEFGQPFSEMNTTPLIDVLLVLLVMLILAVPPAINQVPVDLPSPPTTLDTPQVRHDKNTISITPTREIRWNNQPVSQGQLNSLLQLTLRIKPEPELHFQPDPGAPYDAAAKVLNIIKRSGVSAFGFVGNEHYAAFGKAATASH